MLRHDAHRSREKTGARNLCLAGGVASICVANGQILRDRRFERLWIQPAAGDAGGALGAALAAYQLHNKSPRRCRDDDAMTRLLPRPALFARRDRDASSEPAERALATQDQRRRDRRLPPRDLAEGKAVGWFQGRMEFGPRALGARSILGDARSPTMQTTLNLKIKFRESFRPFAPSVLARGCRRLVRARRRLPVHAARRRRRRSSAASPMTREQQIRFRTSIS